MTVWYSIIGENKVGQQEAGATKRVFLVCSHPLFGQGVESLLCQEKGLEIVGREADACRVMERLRDLQPDVVVVDSADPTCDAMPVVMRILREGVVTRVIELNLRDNTMCVYRGEQQVVKRVEDLLKAISQAAIV